ncbi:MAG TPA: hypothetical protein VH061_09705 [Solirubrobacteraceae bacterium]|nr:hypothetical protein [Solirubrobacteraceae bacterium]
MTDLNTDPLRRLLDEQKRMSDLVSGGPVREMLDAQKRMSEFLGGTQFAAFQAALGDAVDRAAVGNGSIADGEVATEQTLDDAWAWIPTRDQAQGLTEIATFVVALVWFSLALARTEIPETTQRAVDVLLTFAVVMARYARQ